MRKDGGGDSKFSIKQGHFQSDWKEGQGTENMILPVAQNTN